MIRLLNQSDIKILIEFYKNINHIDKEEIKNIYYHMNIDKVVIADIENESITSLLIANIIKNEYYLEDIMFINNDLVKVKELFRNMIDILRNDERGLSIIYDNVPYSDIMHEIMVEMGFKCTYVNYVNDYENKIELIKSNILINDQSEDVSSYITERYNDELKSVSAYLDNIVYNKISLDASKTNLVVARDESNKVCGVLRFSLINFVIYISNIYANDDFIYLDLINTVKNLTSRTIEIGIYPVREELNGVLLNAGFKKYQTEYKYIF